ncbi:MAG: TetR/AcrR family transcriptional regulator [Streptosporangiaceae bacterium]
MEVAPGGRKAKSAETEAALKAAARREFERLGYLNTKITDITAEAGRAAGSFYKHFTSKESVLEALLADMLVDVDDRVAVHPADHDLSDPAMLRAHVEIFWTTLRTHRPELTALFQASQVDQAFAARLTRLMAPERQVMVAHMEYLRDRGVALPGRPDLVAAAMIGLIWQFALEHLDAVADDEAISLLTAFILRGIAGSAPVEPRS